MSIFARFLRLSAAVLAVAGVFGAVWAQASALKSAPFSNSPATLTSNVGSMPIGIEVVAKSNTITYTPTTATGLAFSGTPLLEYNASSGTAAGNTGTIKVETEYLNWDIELKTANNGVLRLNGAATGAALRKTNAAGTGFDTAKVGIQLAIKDYEDNNFKAHTPISTTWINNSKTTAVAFSQVLSITDNNALSTGALKDFLGNRPLNTTGDNTVGKLGFAPPCKSGSTTTSSCDGSITFAVNTGLGISSSGTVKLSGNAPGTYVDTLKFTMIASN